MKKWLVVLLTMALVLSLAACGPADTTPDDDDDDNQTQTYELALVTDIGTIDDKSFNQGAWEGLKQYAEENNKTFKYYQPAEKTTAAYVDSISLAIEGGAKLVVCPGYLFEPAVFQAQDEFPDTMFIILDGQPQDGTYTEFRIEDNVYSVFYAEEQAGFLAGYAAVKEGFTKLGFMGGMAVPAVVRFGYGYVQGAEYAAAEMGIDSIELMYHYTGGFDATPAAQSLAASWYQGGTEVIFGCGGAVGNSVMAAAEEAGKYVIGVDVDQSAESDTVITSAMKMLSISVYDGIADFYAGSFKGGEIVTLDATVDGIGLPMDASKFETFTQADYDAVYGKLVDGSITLLKDTDAADATKLGSEIVNVTLVD